MRHRHAAASALLLALAAGTALAQQPARERESLGQTADRQFDRAEDATRRTVDPPPGEPSLGQKAGRVFDRMEDATARGVDRIRGREPQDTRGMGQRGADAPAR